ncbi:MAG: hypothetical protein FWF67_08470 [Fibromonadales bacterium]|nr:hypothetical protein [Fibromonadales bacterium]
MKTLRTNLCLLLILTAQIYAQKFTAGAIDSIYTGLTNLNKDHNRPPPYGKQIARLGEINSSYANLMLVEGQYNSVLANPSSVGSSKDSSIKIHSYNIVNSYGTVFGTIFPAPTRNKVRISKDEEIYDNNIGAVLVLDSLNDGKKDAIVLFSSLTKLFVTQITLTDANKISYKALKEINLPSDMWYIIGGTSGENRRLALLGAGQSGSDMVYYIAIGNSYDFNKRGRVDFFSLKKDTWDFSRSNTQGLASGIDGLSFEAGSMFGTDLVPIMDKNGKNALAVLLPQSSQYPQSAIYIFSMDDGWTPSKKPPIILTGKSMPWVEESGQNQNCTGLSTANWQKPRLLVSCYFFKSSIANIIVKDIVLDSNFGILTSTTLFSRKANSPSDNLYFIRSNPLYIKNHKNYSHSVSILTEGPANFISGSLVSMLVFPIMDVDYSKNYSIGFGNSEKIVNLDSLFYRNETLGYSIKTLSGLVKCRTHNNNLLCESEVKLSIGSWSEVELSSNSTCNRYRECKRKDTIYVYVRTQEESQNTALRIPRDIVIPLFGRKTFNLESLAHFKNPNSQSTKISWNSDGLKFSTATDNNKPNELSIISPSQKEGIDTIVLNLSIASAVSKYPVRIHVVDTSKILNNGIPENPSNSDTVWNIAQKRYIALPHSNKDENIYTYDIIQKDLEKYAEITGDYLHILKVEIVDILLAYTENSQVKYRKITLMPEKLNSLDKIATSSRTHNFKAMRVNGGLQISGLNGEFEIKAYNFKGVEIQRNRAYAQGSTFVKLEQSCPQIVQIKSGEQKVYVKVVN